MQAKLQTHQLLSNDGKLFVQQTLEILVVYLVLPLRGARSSHCAR